MPEDARDSLNARAAPLPRGAQPIMPRHSRSLGGPPSSALDRWQCTEVMHGFPCHRDACEWDKMRALFAKEDAYVFTTWSGGVPIDDFIAISIKGFQNGVRIAHRVSGSTVDIATEGPAKDRRALGKLKATITQRFTMPCTDRGDCEVDIEADCRLCFFMEKYDGEWKTHFFKGFYEKDRAIPVNPARVPKFDEKKLQSFPDGYRFLAYGQSAKYKIKMDLPQSHGHEHDDFYQAFVDWLNDVPISEMKVKLGV